MREPLLKRHPACHVVTLRDLVGIANAIEQEAVRRYGQPPPEEFEWQLPPELAASWDEIAGTALLTPYRAFSIAVRNEERAFSLYIYLSAHADDARVASEADKLAGEELEHAALLRRWRRAAYHKGRGSPSAARRRITTLEDLHVHLGEREAEIAGCHRVLASRLQELGDSDSAALLESLLDEPTRTPGQVGTCRDVECHSSNPVQLLAAAQKPLERLSEELADVLETADAELFVAAEHALTNVVGRLARLVFQIESKLQWPAPADS